MSMHIVIVTDAWHPQVNGVVRTLETTADNLREWGHEVRFITPQDFRSIACPTYSEIRLSLLPRRRVHALLDRLGADAIHIATEGPLGWAARSWCIENNVPFTSSYHTQFPEYLRLRAPIPLNVSYAVLRRFHNASARTLVATRTQQHCLEEHGFENIATWSRGVDTDLFRPYGKAALDHLPRPVSLYLGRVSVEKNLDAFLGIALPGSKVVIGDGPDLARLKARYPDVHFLGAKFGEDLARHLSAADVFVFPSMTDTFGLVMLEAMACGVPVAGFPVPGPIDVVRDGVTGILDYDLRDAIIAALNLDAGNCRPHALQQGWDNATAQFLQHLRATSSSGLDNMPLRVSLR